MLLCTISTACMYNLLVHYSGDVSRSNLASNPTTMLVPFRLISRRDLPYILVQTKIPSAYNPVENILPASESHSPVLELGNTLPSLINTV